MIGEAEEEEEEEEEEEGEGRIGNAFGISFLYPVITPFVTNPFRTSFLNKVL